MKTVLQRLLFSIALGLALGWHPVQAENLQQRPSLPPEVKELYEALSTSMKTENMPGFMKLFHVSYVYEGEDRASLDRGPWRRLWLNRFADRSYEFVSYDPGQGFAGKEDRLVVPVRAVVVFEEPDNGTKLLERVSFEDTIVRENGTWQFLQRIRKSSTVGQVARAAEIQSPRLAALAASLKQDGESALDTFWSDVAKEGAPLIEPDPESSEGAEQRDRVTFLWRGGDGEKEVLVTEPSRATGGPQPLRNLENSDVWYRTVSLPSNTRLSYGFQLTRAVYAATTAGQKGKVFTVESTSVDPLNSRTVDEKSFLELPGAPVLTALAEVEGRPQGSIERETVRSKLLKERRFVSVYRPPSYDENGAAYPAVFLLDHGSYASRQATRVLLDNLIAEKKIPALVVFLLHSEGSRSADLSATSQFVDFLGTELVAWARKSCHIRSEPADIVIGGNKLGGALALHCASRYPTLFGSVFAETGDFAVCLDPVVGGDQGCAAQRFSTIPKQELNFFLAVAELESEQLVSSSRHLRDVLTAKGYSAPLVRLAGNHNSLVWFEALAQGLENLLGRK